jgi:tripartite-type tricarboxylate transporter receptor subunit TctC
MTTMNRRSALLTCASSLATLTPGLSWAQTAATYPNKPVRWVVPTSTGAGTDFAGRVFAQIASENWKQSLVVENRSGAAGMLGLDFVAGSAADGYTLLFFSVSQFIDATLLQKYSFEANKDFTPIAMLATTPLLLVAHTDAQVSNVQQLIAKAKAQPKALNYSSGGSGGLTHLAMEVFLNKAGIEVLHVPYKGSGPAVIDLLANVVQLSFATPAAVLPHIKSGRLKALGVTSAKRAKALPNVPAIAEVLPGFKIEAWYGLMGPKGMPADLVKKINADVLAILKRPDFQAKLSADAIEPVGGSPEDFAAQIATDLKDWAQLLKSINLKMD